MLGQFTIANNVRCTLNTNISAGATSIILDNATAPLNNFPDPSGDGASDETGIATLVDSLTAPTKVEIVTYKGRSTAGGTHTLTTVTRGQQGTSAQSWTTGACFVYQSPTAAMMSHPLITYDGFSGSIDVTSPVWDFGSTYVYLGGTLNANGATISLPSQSITRANLVNGTAASVMGRASGTGGVIADIPAVTGDTALTYSAGTLDFRKINVAGLNTTGTASSSTVLRGDGAWSSSVAGSWTVGVNFTLSSGTFTVPSNVIARAALVNTPGLSVLGKASSGSGAVGDIAASSDGQFLRRSGGALGFGLMVAANLPGGNWMNATNGTTVCTTTNLVSNVDAWEAVTGTLALPAAGTYLVMAQVSAQVQVSVVGAQAVIAARIYNVTDGAAVGSPCYVASTEAVTTYAAGSGNIHAIVTVAASKTLRIDGQRRGTVGATYTYSAIESTASAGTRLSYIRLF